MFPCIQGYGGIADAGEGVERARIQDQAIEDGTKYILGAGKGISLCRLIRTARLSE